MRTRHLLGIVLIIWIPLGYHLVADEALLEAIPQLELRHPATQLTTDTYDINLMAMSETTPDRQSTLEKVVNYQPNAQALFERLRLPELTTLSELEHPLLSCSLSQLSCRQQVKTQQAELAQLVQRYHTLLQQYEALQYLTDIQPVRTDDVNVDLLVTLPLEQLYALHIYQLMLSGDVAQAQDKLLTLLKQQRRFLSSPTPSLKRILVLANFSEKYLPLALELSQRSPGSRRALATVLQPFSLHEITGLASTEFEYIQRLTLIRKLDRRIAKQALLSASPQQPVEKALPLKLLYKPNLTANTLYQLFHLETLSKLENKAAYYQFFINIVSQNHLIDSTSLSYRLANYRNTIGGTVIALMAPIADLSEHETLKLDLQLQLLQPQLLSHDDTLAFTAASFAINPYNNSSALSINGQWCYQLEQDICLP